MKKNKILVNLFIIVITFITVLTISFQNFQIGSLDKIKGSITGPTGNNRNSYGDWTDLTSVDNDYSYSTLFLTSESEIYVNDSFQSIQDGQVMYSTSIYSDGRPTPMVHFYDNNAGRNSMRFLMYLFLICGVLMLLQKLIIDMFILD